MSSFGTSVVVFFGYMMGGISLKLKPLLPQLNFDSLLCVCVEGYVWCAIPR